MLHSEATLLAVGSRQTGVPAINRRSDNRQRRSQRSPHCCVKQRHGSRTIGYLLKPLLTILLKHRIETRQHVPIEEYSVAGSHDPPRHRLIRQAETRTEVIGILPQTQREMLEVVTNAQVDG